MRDVHRSSFRPKESCLRTPSPPMRENFTALIAAIPSTTGISHGSTRQWPTGRHANRRTSDGHLAERKKQRETRKAGDISPGAACRGCLREDLKGGSATSVERLRIQPHVYSRGALRRSIPALCAALGQRGCQRLTTNGAKVAKTGMVRRRRRSRLRRALTRVRRQANCARNKQQEMTINAIAGLLDDAQAHGATYC